MRASNYELCKGLFLFFSRLIFFIWLTGCSMLYKGTGEVLIAYAEDQAVPYIMATDDVALGCSMTEAFTPFLLSFSRVTVTPDRLAILFYLLAGHCAEFKAWEAELGYLRAIHAKNPVLAQDARIVQQRLLALAARRQLLGYQALVAVFSEPAEACPVLIAEHDELYWLMGLLNGLQAIINDIASGGHEGVPMDIAAKVGRGAACLNNKKWWGVPEAIQAVIWMSIPGQLPVDKNPQAMIQRSLKIGREQGINLAQVLAAQAYMGKGEIEVVKNIIGNYARLSIQTPESQLFKILNEVSRLQIQGISDRLWTKATGRRTPYGRIGYFWDDSREKVETIDIDQLL